MICIKKYVYALTDVAEAHLDFLLCVLYLYVLLSSVYSTLLINFIFFRQKMLAKM